MKKITLAALMFAASTAVFAQEASFEPAPAWTLGNPFVSEKAPGKTREQVKADKVDFPVGSQLVKAAWREVSPREEKYFVTTDACVCEDVAGDEPGNCSVKRMGLAGFHLHSRFGNGFRPPWFLAIAPGRGESRDDGSARKS